ncbi:MAG: hypothetical protein ACPG5B_01850 [Chitinophagales bacterium]
MKKLIYLFGMLIFFGINSNIFAQSSTAKMAKTHHQTSDTKPEQSLEQKAAIKKQAQITEQEVRKAGKEKPSIDIETLKQLKREQIKRKQGKTSVATPTKSNRSFPIPSIANYGKKANISKYSEAELEQMKQQKQGQKLATKTSTKRKGLAPSSKNVVRTSYSKESLRKKIAELEQKVFCAEESGTMKADEIEKMKQAISNREKILKTLD